MSLDNPSTADLVAAGLIRPADPSNQVPLQAGHTVIKPTVGRAVHYWNGGSHEGHVMDNTQPHHATIVYVHPGQLMVNLACFDHMGFPYRRDYVRIEQPTGREYHGQMTATWPTRT